MKHKTRILHQISTYFALLNHQCDLLASYYKGEACVNAYLQDYLKKSSLCSFI